jgi:hypothetical protein
MQSGIAAAAAASCTATAQIFKSALSIAACSSNTAAAAAAAAVSVSRDGMLWAATHETWLGSSQPVSTSVYVCSGNDCDNGANWSKRPSSELNDLMPGATYQVLAVSG